MFDLIGKTIRVWPHIQALLGYWPEIQSHIRSEIKLYNKLEPHITIIVREFYPVVHTIEEVKEEHVRQGTTPHVADAKALKQVLTESFTPIPG